MTKLILTTMELCGNKCHACAIEEEGQIMELRLEAAARQSILGNIYVGQVENIASNIHPTQMQRMGHRISNTAS